MSSQEEGFDGRFDSVDFTSALELIEVITGHKARQIDEYDLTAVDPAGRVQVRIDKNNAPKEMVERFASQMAFSVFPPIVVTEDNRIIDGNTRVAARRKREERFCTALVVPVSWDEGDGAQRIQIEYLGLALNNSNGKALDRIERRKMVKDALEMGMSPRQVQVSVGFPLNVVNGIRHEIAGEHKLGRVGLTDIKLRDATLRALGRASEMNDDPFRELAVLTADAGFSAAEIKALAASVRETGSDQLGIERIGREREANAQRIADRKRGGDGHPPASRKLRQHLGFILKQEPAALLETNVEQMAEHTEMISDSIDVLQDLLAAQQEVIRKRVGENTPT